MYTSGVLMNRKVYSAKESPMLKVGTQKNRLRAVFLFFGKWLT